MKDKRILYVSSEVVPYLPETEISSMSFEAPRLVNQQGGQIRIFMPRYGNINERRHQLHEVIRLSGINLVINDLDMPLIIKVASIPKERIQEMSVYGKVREVEDGNYAINITRKAMNAKKQKTPVRVVDADKNPIKDLIGNGSAGNIIVYQYDWEVSGRTGRKTVLIAVQVTDLIKYVPLESVDFDVLEPVANDNNEVSSDF